MLLQELFSAFDRKHAKQWVPQTKPGQKNADDPLAQRDRIGQGYEKKFKDAWGNNYLSNKLTLTKKLMRMAPLSHTKSPLPEEEELTEAVPGWRWSSQWDEQTFISLQSLVKHNNGLFKSAKQAAFLGDAKRWGEKARTDSGLQKYFGIPFDPAKGDTFAMSVDAYMTFADYGKRSMRPVTYFFIFDKYGVTRKYQLHYVGDMRKGTSPDPAKTELKWQRPEGVDTSTLDAELNQAADVKANPPAPTGQHIGTVGERIVFELTTKALIDRGIGQFGQQWLNVFSTADGNTVMYNGYLSRTKGEQVKVKATIKKHVTGKDGSPITIISRPKRIEP